jgi:hypothetical protein
VVAFAVLVDIVAVIVIVIIFKPGTLPSAVPYSWMHKAAGLELQCT